MSTPTITPAASGTSTPTGATASSLTAAGIKHVHKQQQHEINGTHPSLSPLDASRLQVTLSTESRTVPDPDSPETHAQKTCTDHMVTARWTAENGWDAPELKPFGPLSIMPTASVLHYATECFEGLKLYRGFDNKLRLFRVSRNCQRMRKSAARIALPDFDAEELEKLIIALCARDGSKWLPRDARKGSFLYIRPTLIGTDAALGVQRPKEALLYVMLACFPDMSRSLAPVAAPPALNGEVPVEAKTVEGLKLLASTEDTIRAWPGGFGFAKVGANYGPSLMAQGEARARGFDQVLWLFGQENFVTEAGASNFFVVIREKASGKLRLITAPLHERIILEGVTRASVLDIAKERLTGSSGLEAVEVVEERFVMADIIEASREGRLVEAFAAGTAFFIAPVQRIHFRGQDIEVPMGPTGEAGEYATQIREWLKDIMYGRVSHEWGVLVEEEA